MNRTQRVHPYIPNSAAAVRTEMLAAVRAETVEDLYTEIPQALRMTESLDLPAPLPAEADLARHVHGLLNRNTTIREYLSFLGAGCYDHFVPTVCDEINGRAEFLTAYAGETYEDHGKFQALFEYTSMMGEMLEMDVVTVPTYDGFQASATALRVAGRATGRRRVLVLGPVDPDKMAKIRDYARPALDLEPLSPDGPGGSALVDELATAMGADVAAVYVEVPNHFGMVESELAAIGEIAHAHHALFVVSCDPISLGVLAPPASYGADIVCGDIQSLGIHLQFGGGHGGYLALHDDPILVMELPSRLLGLAPTAVPGELGFTDVAYERTSLAVREEANEWVGTAAALWGITAGSYLALMGPRGMAELGETILARTRYAMDVVSRVPGLTVPFVAGSHFREFVVRIERPGVTVAELNAGLLAQGIFGGKDLSCDFSALGQSALYCVTETTRMVDIDRLGEALKDILR
ncbi:aminomethyl-transferring glycine dehydrogenase subunit GcvPA [Micromonospora sp. NPDC048830]|uniref:aminomethyl-transferring glycine dehydrogenase subunit GcvPA n=1 Tax=Micromonospora sp. NPDC048830 TaxID=3364257 RepID=UPI00371D9E97